jgi:hypothetical protein
MAQMLHARKIDGEWRYKLWSTVVDAYTTYELTEDQVRRQILMDVITRAIDEHEREWPGRLARAQKHGTSARDYADDSCWHDINGPWKTERGS